jgi:hypothetical protein
MKSRRCADLQNVILNIRHNPETVCGASSTRVGSHLSGDLPLAKSNPLEVELNAWSGDVAHYFVYVEKCNVVAIYPTLPIAS